MTQPTCELLDNHPGFLYNPACDIPSISVIAQPISPTFRLTSSGIYSENPMMKPERQFSVERFPLTRDEILFLIDSLKDLEEGRCTTVRAEESEEEFFRKLDED